jgi:polar amino acid transport system substrate-binding protein
MREKAKMKKLLACALVGLVLAAVPAMAEKSFINGIDPNYPPFAYMDEKTGQPAGFDVDSMNWIANAMGFKVTHKPIAWDGIIPALLAKQIDMIDSGMSITPDRSKVVQFSNPYWTVSRVFLVAADSTLTPEQILSEKIRLGVQRGTSEASDIKKEQQEKNYPFELRFYDSAPLAVEDLLNGRIQAALMDELPANDAIEKGRAVKKAGIHGKPDEFGVAMRKEDKELHNLINEGYKKLLADPYWKELQKKYLNK